MENLIWPVLALVGIIAGFFVQTATVAKIVGALFGLAVAGLIACSVIGLETWVWVFGIAAMGIPMFGGTALLGALAGAWLRRFFSRGT